VNKCFQDKRAKYYNLHIIEATVSIPTKFCTTIKTCPNSKYASNESKMADGRHDGVIGTISN